MNESISLICTCSRGFETFVVSCLNYLHESVLVSQENIYDGKVILSVKGRKTDIIQFLKFMINGKNGCAERAFFLFSHVKISHWKNDLNSLLTGLTSKLTEHLFFKTLTVFNLIHDQRINRNLSFRIHAKCKGRFKGKSTLIETTFCKRICSLTKNWKLNIRNPDIILYLYLSDGLFLFGFPLCKGSLTNKFLSINIGLRTSVCHVLGYLSDLRRNNLLLFDPVCGKSTIARECLMNWPYNFILGGEIEPSLLESSRQDLSRLSSSYDLIQHNAQVLPLRSSVIDVVLCDLPFGLKKYTPDHCIKFYSSLMNQLHRILIPNALCILLTSEELSDALYSIITGKKLCDDNLEISYIGDLKRPSVLFDFPKWKLVNSHYVKLGETHGRIIIVQKK